MARMRAAASSIARGMPSKRRQISLTKSASLPSSNRGATARARSTNKATAGEATPSRKPSDGTGRYDRQSAVLARRFAAMETNVLIYDPYMYSETIRGNGYEPVADLDEGIARADFITIHCPKTPETTGMFNAARLAKMKKTAFLVNTARGGIVDEAALYDALKNKRIAGAALDVFVEEPTPQDNPLLTLDNFIAAPHVAGVTREAVDRMAIVAVQNILSVIDGKPNRENTVNKEVLA